MSPISLLLSVSFEAVAAQFKLIYHSFPCTVSFCIPPPPPPQYPPFLPACLPHSPFSPQDDPKVSLILSRLLEVLNTPSEAVQRAVSDCLPPLMPAIAKQVREGGREWGGGSE